MNENETVTISKAEYDEMKERLDFLQCLEDAGVDNWSGIYYAHEEFEKMHPRDGDET